MEAPKYEDSYVKGILADVKTIAMVGASTNWNRPSYFAMKYLQAKGYRVIPVNPVAAGQELLGETVRASLEEIEEPVDMVDIFRNGKGRMEAQPWLMRDPENVEMLLTFLFEEAPPGQEDLSDPGEGGKVIYSHSGYNQLLDQNGYPANAPPWGTLNAIDLNKGTIKWQVTLGEYADLKEKGVPPTGTENWGGPVLTQSGLIFIAAAADDKLRAFDKETGEVLWEGQLPTSGFATPSTYSVDGRQYVVIACGGGKVSRPTSSAFVAFALPQ